MQPFSPESEADASLLPSFGKVFFIETVNVSKQTLILHLLHFSLTWCLGEGEMGGREALCLCRCTSHLWILFWSTGAQPWSELKSG